MRWLLTFGGPHFGSSINFSLVIRHCLLGSWEGFRIIFTWIFWRLYDHVFTFSNVLIALLILSKLQWENLLFSSLGLLGA